MTSNYHNSNFSSSNYYQNGKLLYQSSLFEQFKALLARNITIKRKEKQKTLFELLMPLYFIVILAVIRMFLKDAVFQAITTPHDGVSLTFHNNTLLLGPVLVTPNSKMIERIMSDVMKISETSNENILYFASENEILNYYKVHQNISVALIFTDDPLSTPSYTIRVNPSLPLVSEQAIVGGGEQCRAIMMTGLENGVSCPPNSYYHFGFLALQRAIDITLINLLTNKTVEPVHLFLQSFPLDQYTSLSKSLTLRGMVPLYMVFAWAQFIFYMMVLIVEEKEKKIKECMRMMGLQISVYWLAWITIYFAYIFLLAVISVVVLSVSGVFQKANLLLLFILFLLYGVSSIFLALMLTPFFSKAKTAGVVGQLLQIFMSLLYYLQVYLSDKIGTPVFWALGLMSPCAFSLAIDKVILFDFASDGLQWGNIWEGDGLPFAGSLIMISFDIVLYLCLGVYLDCIIPGEFGVRRLPWFIFQKSTWTNLLGRPQYKVRSQGSAGFDYPMGSIDPNIEPFPREWSGREAIRIRNLHKVFRSRGKDDVIAVNGISLDAHEGQITAILGHNGAGKTTLINLLTGMQFPDLGKAFIWGYDISDFNSQLEIRRRTGVCPQHDILFPNLTPKEHLKFYGRIKGLPTNVLEREIETLLEEVDMKNKDDCKASELSGGQKRKLSIAIALIGDPPLLFLDEPTAGVDAYSRRKLWTLLTKRKKGKVIILTTHFMDEADILADRKAIISKGKLRCYGTSLFLKNRFGLGYHLTVVISEAAVPRSLLDIVQKVIPSATLARHFGNELSFLLPSDTTNDFPQLFQFLDARMFDTQSREIESYGVSLTSLEEVFLALNSDEFNDTSGTINDVVQHLVTRSSSADSPSRNPPNFAENESQLPVETQAKPSPIFDFENVDIKKSKWREFKSVMRIRFLSWWREPVAVVFMTIFPLIFVCAGLAIASNSGSASPENDSPLILSADLYSSMGNTDVLLFNDTGEVLSPIESSLADAGLVPSLYNGSYSLLAESQPHFSSIDVQKLSLLAGGSNITLRYNTTFTHILPILINLIDNSLLISLGEEESPFFASQLQVSTKRLPATTSSQTFTASSFASPILIGVAFATIPASLVIDLIHDRSMNGRNILRLNGISFNVYFASYFSVLISFYAVSYAGLLIIIQAFQVPSLVVASSFTVLALLYLLYMPVIMLFSAIVGYMFDSAETARQFYPSLSQMLGFISFTLVIVSDSLTASFSTAKALHILFTFLLPYYLPFGAIYFITRIYFSSTFLGADPRFADFLTPEILSMFIACLIHIPVFYVLLRVVDSFKLGGSIREALWLKHDSSVNDVDGNLRSQTTESEDVDVTEERDRLKIKLENGQTHAPALLYKIGKKYNKRNLLRRQKPAKDSWAVKSVSFEVVPGSVFGLLGPNGAGKTTSLRIMTAEEQQTEGRVYISGNLITSSMSRAFEYLGYCPQHDCLWANLTVEEHIECFANMNGVDSHRIKELIDAYVNGLKISEHRNKKSKDCSGGTKRKLSYILSMIGKAKIVLLDEPSTGMDPQSKRFLWDSILANFQRDRCAILTTHSMEEANALCSRIGILVKGEFKCLGSVQHLKSKYGGGYTLEMKLRPSTVVSENDTEVVHNGSANLEGMYGSFHTERISQGDNEAIKRLIRDKFPGASVKEEFEGRLVFDIGKGAINLARIFQLLETLKVEEVIEEYSLSQTTLEQVFLHFARQQDQDQNEDLMNVDV